jgi:hypothetical protein
MRSATSTPVEITSMLLATGIAGTKMASVAMTTTGQYGEQIATERASARIVRITSGIFFRSIGLFGPHLPRQ